MFSIWDLDGTVIDSRHRHATHADGSLDLEHWIANNTPAKISRDTLLPLIHKMRQEKADGKFIIICTARVLQTADFRFLLKNDVPFDAIISRAKGETTPDAEMKIAKLDRFFKGKDWGPRCEMWEDNDNVLAAMRERGVKCNDAKTLNYPRCF